MHILKTATLSLVAAAIAAAPALAQEHKQSNQHKKMLDEIRAIIREEVQNAMQKQGKASASKKSFGRRSLAIERQSDDLTDLKKRITSLKQRIAKSQKHSKNSSEEAYVIRKGKIRKGGAGKGGMERVMLRMVDDEHQAHKAHADSKKKVMSLQPMKAQKIEFGDIKMHKVDGKTHSFNFGGGKGKGKAYFFTEGEKGDHKIEVIVEGHGGNHFQVDDHGGKAQGMWKVLESKGHDGKGDKTMRLEFKGPEGMQKFFGGKMGHGIKSHSTKGHDGKGEVQFLIVGPDGKHHKMSKSFGIDGKAFTLGTSKNLFQVKGKTKSKSKSKATQSKSSCCGCCQCGKASAPSHKAHGRVVEYHSDVKMTPNTVTWVGPATTMTGSTGTFQLKPHAKTVKGNQTFVWGKPQSAKTNISGSFIYEKGKAPMTWKMKSKNVKLEAPQVRVKRVKLNTPKAQNAPKTPKCCPAAKPTTPKGRIMI